MNPWQYMAPSPREIDEEARARQQSVPVAPPSAPAPAQDPGMPSGDAPPPVEPMPAPVMMPPPVLPQVIRTPDRKIDLESTQRRTTNVKETNAERAAMGDIASADQAQVKAAEGARDLGVKVAEAQSGIIADEAARRAAFEAERDRKRAEITQGLDAELAAQRKKYADHKETSIFKGRPGAQLLSALASGIGAAAAAITKTPNYALEIVNQNIANHISKERAAREQLLERAKMSEQDRRLALAALDLEDQNKRAAFLDASADQRALTLSKFGADQARIAGDEMIAKLRGEAARARQAVESGKRSIVESVEAKNQQFAPGSTTVVRPGGGAGGGEQNLVRGPGGRALFAVGDKKQAAELSEAIAARRNLQDLIKQQTESFEKYGAEAMGEEKAARESRFTAALQTVRSLESMGALDKGTTDVFEKQFPTNTSRFFGRGDGAAKLRQFAGDVDMKLASKLDAAGAPGVQAIRAIDSMEGGAPRAAPSPGRAPLVARQKAAAMKWIRENPNDPRAAEIRATLRGGG